MKKADLAAIISLQNGVSKLLAGEILTTVQEAYANALATGDFVLIDGVGKLSVKKTPARTGRNPKTGETFPISERNRVSFKPSSVLKAKLNDK